MTIILISTLVSLITIFSLFFKISKPEKKEIPSWFLGDNKKSPEQKKIRILLPPIFLIIIVIFITAILGYLYNPKQNSQKQDLNTNTILWIDPSFSTKMSLSYGSKDLKNLASSILKKNTNIYGISNNFKIKDSLISINYKIQILKSKKSIDDFITQEIIKAPSPFYQSINSEYFLNTINEFFKNDLKNMSILVISDGKTRSLQSFLTLSPIFSSGSLIKLPESFLLSKESQEIIPKDLAEAWGFIDRKKNDFIPFKEDQNRIPIMARPSLFVNKYTLTNNKYLRITELKKTSNNLPMLIACKSGGFGPYELDSFAAIRTIYSFFSDNFIEINCEQNFQDNLSDNKLWKYRENAIWILPLNKNSLSVLFRDRTFWLPQGFNANTDTLVYTAPLFSTFPSDITEIPVQISNDEIPLILRLGPEPPAGNLNFQYKDSKLSYQTQFRPIYTSKNNVTLAWKTNSFPFFFLRTATSSPSNELARSNDWLQFWLKVAETVQRNNQSISTIELDDANRLKESLEQNLGADKISQQLNLENLKFEPANYLSLGIYQLQPSNKIVVFTADKFNKENNFMSENDFSELFPKNNINDNSNTNTNQVSILSYLLLIIGFLLLYILWHKKSITLLILLIFPFFLVTKPSYSQTADKITNSQSFFNENQILSQKSAIKNVGFSIGWCEPTIPTEVEKNYRILKDLLENRGTIRLAEAMIPNGCEPFKTDLWWMTNYTKKDVEKLKDHVLNGGTFIIEGEKKIPNYLLELNDTHIGLAWENLDRRSLFYRSFYLLKNLDGCVNDETQVLMLRKKKIVQSPYGIIIKAHFLTTGDDCFKINTDYKQRSLINIFYGFLTTDYKDDQIRLPELLNRIRNLGLEP